MTRLPPEERPTAAELAGARGSNVCPKCGAPHMKANGTRELESGTIHRYRYCRNPACGARFFEVQAPPRIVREVKPHRDEDDKPVLKVRSA